MCQCIETIHIGRGIIYNLDYHTNRMNRTRAVFWPEQPALELSKYLYPVSSEGVMKCRVIYGREIEEITYTSYQIRPVHSLQIVYSDDIDYTYKSTDRSVINELFARRQEQDDILIVKNGLLTDTSIGNIALFDGNEWYTPKQPLLKGTRRASLLAMNLIKEKEITVERLFEYSQICLFNAMIDFGKIKIDVNQDLIRI
ncbi:aminotransferase class IV [Bacteroides fragilis]|uniref:aminotransferase class IV family protein n=1 Tax=Bacteroides fragilis TaxID=817 RepID=UPI001F44DE8F|nr:aminotransferase class IV family protein [Bacteroides fragilis]MCF2690835.1 aminotransferase class IV [Bacteroides fragilis]